MSVWIKKFSAPLTVNGSLLKTSRHLSHFMKQDSSGNFNESELSMTKWTKVIDGWFQFDYVLDLAKGTGNQYIVIG